MIIINLFVSELSSGYAVIEQFLETMREEWLPGFEKSYIRRSKEYQEAIKKHEERGLFLRTLLKKPKAPNRMPPRYPGELESRLLHDWHDSFRSGSTAAPETIDSVLSEELGDDYLLAQGLQIHKDATPFSLLVGPAGIFLNKRDALDNLITIIQQNNLKESMNEAIQEWPQSPTVIGEENLLDPAGRFSLLDVLLAKHQSLNQGRPFSAKETAEKLTAREKDNLIRMAAIL